MLYLFDLDGTLIENFLVEENGRIVSRYEWPYERVEVMPGVKDKLLELSMKSMRSVGVDFNKPGLGVLEGETTPHGFYRYGICTNQGGVAMGYQTPREVWTKMGEALGALGFFLGQPHSLHVAMHAPNAKVPGWDNEHEIKRRKPNPGMLIEAMQFHVFPPHETVFVGDMENDRLAAERAGVEFQWADEFFGR